MIPVHEGSVNLPGRHPPNVLVTILFVNCWTVKAMTFDFSSWPQFYTVTPANIVTEGRSGKCCDGQETEIHVKLEKCCVVIGGNKARRLLFFAHSFSVAKLPWWCFSWLLLQERRWNKWISFSWYQGLSQRCWAYPSSHRQRNTWSLHLCFLGLVLGGEKRVLLNSSFPHSLLWVYLQ